MYLKCVSLFCICYIYSILHLHVLENISEIRSFKSASLVTNVHRGNHNYNYILFQLGFGRDNEELQR